MNKEKSASNLSTRVIREYAYIDKSSLNSAPLNIQKILMPIPKTSVDLVVVIKILFDYFTNITVGIR